MANEYTELRAPYPNHKVTTILPKPRFTDSRKTEARVTVKRTKDGTKTVYRDSSDRIEITLPFLLTRMKQIELERFLLVYQGADIRIDLYDGSQWAGKLTGRQVGRTFVDRKNDDYATTGKELVEVTLTFSAIRLS